MRDRDAIWGDRFKYKAPKLYWNQLYPREIELKRQELYPILKLIKGNDKYRKISSISGDKLIVDGRAYTSDTLHNLPDDITYRSSIPSVRMK